jgi:hypothetical protein
MADELPMSATWPTPSAAPARRVYVGVTPAQRRRAVRQFTSILGLWLLGVAIFGLSIALRSNFPVDLSVLLAFLVPLTLVLLIPFGRLLGQRRRMKSLADAGLICSRCAYSMQGLDQSIEACPECGQPRVHASRATTGA